MTARVDYLRRLGAVRLPSVVSVGHLEASSLERFFTAVILFYTSGAIGPPLLGGNSPLDPAPIRPLELGIKLLFYCIAFGLMLFNWRSCVCGMWNIKWVLTAVALCVASVAWSQFPTLTMRGSAVLVGTTLFGIYVGVRYSVREQLDILAWVIGAGIVMSLVFVIWLPSYGVNRDVTAGAWQGAFAQKNNLGQVMVLGILVFAFWQISRRSWVRWLAISASVTMLLLSRSATGVVVCIITLLAIPLYKLVRARITLVIPLGIGLCVFVFGLVLVASANSGELLRLLHRGRDLTGRTELWTAVLYSISKRPWLGYGFSAFWEGMKGESETVLEAVGWSAWYSHDGFLDVLVQVGIVGLVLWVGGYLILWWRAIAFAARSTGPAALWLCTYLLFMMIYNVTEGSILSQNGIYWVLYIATAASLYPLKNRARKMMTTQIPVMRKARAY